MPTGNTAKSSATVARELGTGHVHCPSCDHKISISKIVAWHLRSLFDSIARTGKPVRLHGLGTFFVKNGKLTWRNDSRFASAFREMATTQQDNKTTGSKTTWQ